MISASKMKHDQMIAEVIKSVRQTVGPVAAFKTAIIVDGLPKVWSEFRGQYTCLAPATCSHRMLLGQSSLISTNNFTCKIMLHNKTFGLKQV